jgi:hypothetical protein
MAIPTIDGGTFNFTQTGYTPPTWSGGIYDFDPLQDDYSCYTEWVDEEKQWVESDWLQWNECIGILRQVWTDENYVYAATTSGLEIIDIVTESLMAWAYDYDVRTVWADDDRVYFGTWGEGVKYLAKTTFSGSLSAQVKDFARYPEIQDDHVNYIHGNLSQRMLISNIMGVDFYRLDWGAVNGSVSLLDAGKCFMAEDYTMYYISASGTRLNVKAYPGGDWSSPDTYYDVGGDVFSRASRFNDIFITTATDNSMNTIFAATDAGVYVYGEGTGRIARFTTVSGG